MTKSVLLYSGGLDSFIASYLFKPDLCLYVECGSRYELREREGMVPPAHGELRFDSRLHLGDLERDDLIIPNRNAYFVLLASHHADTILMAATHGDRSYDKDYEFARHMTALLSHMWRESHWTEGRTIRVELPMRVMTKTRAVAVYLEKHGNPELLKQAVSCYSGNLIHCGSCKACARKWVALYLNGIEWNMDRRPWNYFTPEMLARANRGLYRGASEDREIVEAVTHARGRHV